MELAKVKMHNNNLLVLNGDVQGTTKTSPFLNPQTKLKGVIVKAPDDQKDWERKTVYFGGQYAEIDLDGKKYFTMRTDNIILSVS